MEVSWETELATLLNDLLAVQQQTLDILGRKLELLKVADAEGLAGLADEEAQIVDTMRQCLDRRKQLLAQAKQQRLPSENISSLIGTLPPEKQSPLSQQVEDAHNRARLLQHHSITNWVVTQRSLLHLSQLLEIIATGGRLQPTYGEGATVNTGGTLVDRAA